MYVRDSQEGSSINCLGLKSYNQQNVTRFRQGRALREADGIGFSLFGFSLSGALHRKNMNKF